MNKAFKLFPILMSAPFLMANSPMPVPVRKNYNDIEATIHYQGIDDYDRYDKYAYLVTITNTGKEYVAPYSILQFHHQNYENYYYFSLENHDQLFMNETIAPGQTKTYLSHSSTQIDTSKEYVFEMECFNNPEEKMTFSNSEIKKYRNQPLTYILKTNVSNVGDYYYCLFLDITYQDKPYTFCIDSFTKGTRTFTTYKELELDKITINGIHAYRSSNNTYKGGFYIDTSTILEFITIAAFILSVGAAIAIPTSITAARRRKNKQEVH